ncbi:hypothetical protein OROMI_019755 [Orobanche minor]
MADDHFQKPSTTASDAHVDGTEDHKVAAESSCIQDMKQLEFTRDEKTLIVRMYSLVGERWSLIAGRIPGRSAEEIEKYWNYRQSKLSEKELPNYLILAADNRPYIISK